MLSKNIKYLPAIDILRGFAALLVVMYHGFHLFSYQLNYHQSFQFDHWPHSLNPLTTLLIEGHTAVTLFMVTSGFIFTFGNLNKTRLDYRYFIYNRVLRIYPLMLLIIAIALSLHPDQFALWPLLKTLGLMANTQGALAIEPFTSMFWTIAVEFQFYLIFPLLLRLLQKKGPKALIALIFLTIAARWIAVCIFDANPRDLSYWTIAGRIDQFLMGMLVGWYVLKHDDPPRTPPHLLLIYGFLSPLLVCWSLNQAGGWPIASIWKIFFPPIEALAWSTTIAALLYAKWPSNRLVTSLQRIGESSYSIYMQHMFYLSAITLYLARNQPKITISPQLYALTITLLALIPICAHAHLTYQFVEKPFLKLRQKYNN